MNFQHTEDRRMLMDSLNRFVAEQYSADTRNQMAYGAQGHSPQLYEQLAELGTIGATPAVVNAVADALARHGKGTLSPKIQMPMTPARIWELLQHG